MFFYFLFGMNVFATQSYRFFNTLLRCAGILFVLLFLISFPFGSAFLLPDPGHYTGSLFRRMAAFTGRYLFHMPSGYTGEIASDTIGMYINLLVVAMMALVLSIPVTLYLCRKKISPERLYRAFRIVISYYLALQLLRYGWNKVFKTQFYLPEPNTLFTTVGDTPRDLLYWSTMGLSRSYSLFMGLIEVVPAFLLFFRKTRSIGAFILSAVLLQVAIVNFSFDISVKVYSCFLLMLALLIAMPVYRLLFRFFILEQRTFSQQKVAETAYRHRLWTTLLQAGVICWFLLDSLWPYLRSGNYNDDLVVRPPLHGAWQVDHFSRNGDTMRSRNAAWDKAFVHRRGYFIIQQQGAMKDYKLYYDTAARRIGLQDYEQEGYDELSYWLQGDSLLHLTGVLNRDTLSVGLKRIDLAQLPALQNEFNWTTEE